MDTLELSANKDLTKLFELINEKCIFRGPVILSSGAQSNYYIDCRLLTMTHIGTKLIAKCIYDEIKNKDITAIGGPEAGAIPIATAVVNYCVDKPDIKGFFV